MRATIPARGLSLVSVLAACSGLAHAQCPLPAIYELGGQPSAICTAGSLVEAMARGRFVDIVSTPVSGSPSLIKTLSFQHRLRHMSTEFAGSIWATDGSFLYRINTSTPASASIATTMALPASEFPSRLRVKGNFVYALSDFSLCIIDISNPGAPIVRSSTPLANVDQAYDLEVVGSFAYIGIDDASPGAAKFLVMDIGNPLAPTEVRRVGTDFKIGARLASDPSTSSLYVLSGRFLNPTALERWSLTNASNPTLAATASVALSNVTTGDELQVAPGGLCRASSIGPVGFNSGAFGVYNKSTLAEVSIVPLPGDTITMGMDGIFGFTANLTGEVSRVNLLSPATPAVEAIYRDAGPGTSSGVATINNGYSVVNSTFDACVFLTPAGSAPTLLAHLHPQPNFTYDERSVLLFNDNTMFIAQVDFALTTTRLMAYQVIVAPTPSVSFLGSLDLPGVFTGFDGGSDATSSRRIYCCTRASGAGTLRLVNAANPGAMSQTSSFALTTGVSGVVKYVPPFQLAGRPGRVYVGGTGGKTQIVSVDNPNSLFSEGVVPSGSQKILYNGSVFWLLDSGTLWGYDLSTPATPTPLYALSTGIGGAVDDAAFTDPFGQSIGMISSTGLFARVLVQGAPSYLLIGPAAEQDASGIAFDGTNAHLAAGVNGYVIAPTNFQTPPAEDPSKPVFLQGRRGLFPTCGPADTIKASFVANPAPTSYQWYRAGTPMGNGPTGTGSTISGATSDTLTIATPGPSDVGNYYCVANNACGSARTSNAFVRVGGYANCDNSTTPPALSASDFVCFLNAFRAGNNFANCDGSTGIPLLSAGDFVCFLNTFRASGCP